jgi:Trk K+ transport system NAD-binding subunit
MLIERHSKKVDRDIFTCVELLNRDNMEQLEVMGVEELVFLDDYGGSIIAASSANQGMVKIFNELFHRGWGNTFIKHPISSFPELVGQKVLDAVCWLKEHRNAILLAVERTDESGAKDSIVNPSKDEELKEDDLLILIAPTRHGSQ